MSDVMWLVWKEQNSRIFKDLVKSIDQMKSLLIRTLFDWSRAWGFTHCTLIFDFQS